MRKLFIFLAVLCATMAQAATVYTRINSKPSEGWPGTYLLVIEKNGKIYNAQGAEVM